MLQAGLGLALQSGLGTRRVWQGPAMGSIGCVAVIPLGRPMCSESHWPPQVFTLFGWTNAYGEAVRLSMAARGAYVSRRLMANQVRNVLPARHASPMETCCDTRHM